MKGGDVVDEDKMVRVSNKTHLRIKNLQLYALKQRVGITIKDIVDEAVNCLPKAFFKKVKRR